MSEALAAAGYLVLRYDLPFRRERPKGPPFPAQAARDRQGVAHAVEALRKLVARAASSPAAIPTAGARLPWRPLSTANSLADALLLFSYPLHPPGKPDRKRTAFFGDLRISRAVRPRHARPVRLARELRAGRWR